MSTAEFDSNRLLSACKNVIENRDSRTVPERNLRIIQAASPYMPEDNSEESMAPVLVALMEAAFCVILTYAGEGCRPDVAPKTLASIAMSCMVGRTSGACMVEKPPEVTTPEVEARFSFGPTRELVRKVAEANDDIDSLSRSVTGILDGLSGKSQAMGILACMDSAISIMYLHLSSAGVPHDKLIEGVRSEFLALVRDLIDSSTEVEIRKMRRKDSDDEVVGR